MTPETQTQAQDRTRGRHAIVGRLVALDELAGEAVVRTDQGRKITATHLTPPLVEVLAGRMLRPVLLVGFATWGGNGGLSDFRPFQVLEFDEGAGDPGIVDALYEEQV